ncbi:MAG: hypothetical protein QM499_00320 [Flavobacteriaceae bacterium]
MKLKNLFLFTIALYSFSVFGQNNSEMGGPPTRLELIGYWKKINHPKEKELNKVNPWPQKYQWFAFYENGKVQSMMTGEDYEYNSEELTAIFKVFSNDQIPDYKLNGQMLTITNDQIKDYQELWGVNLFAADLNEFIKKGTLVMTLDNGNGEIIYYRFLKKIE